MKKIIIIAMIMIAGVANAQAFDFECETETDAPVITNIKLIGDVPAPGMLVQFKVSEGTTDVIGRIDGEIARLRQYTGDDSEYAFPIGRYEHDFNQRRYSFLAKIGELESKLRFIKLLRITNLQVTGDTEIHITFKGSINDDGDFARYTSNQNRMNLNIGLGKLKGHLGIPHIGDIGSIYGITITRKGDTDISKIQQDLAKGTPVYAWFTN